MDGSGLPTLVRRERPVVADLYHRDEGRLLVLP